MCLFLGKGEIFLVMLRRGSGTSKCDYTVNDMPVYPNWKRELAQTQCSLGSNPRTGTMTSGISVKK